MNYDDPLPLILPDGDFDELDAESLNHTNLYWYGIGVLALSWSLFIITANSVFQCWKYVIEPLSWSPKTRQMYESIHTVGELFDDYVVSFWCLYVIAWWWALFCWCGLKLFKQSKGTQT